ALRYLHSFPTRRSSDLTCFERPCEKLCFTVPESDRLRVRGRRWVFSVSLVSLIHSLRLQAVRLQPIRPEERPRTDGPGVFNFFRSEEHTSELQSRENLV